ncbi:hypothetical protein [Siminovitchia fortis]|uniref:Uncharacterized protein n=1 Tax=Siminovitchia fortis TaxID=254758 RepID=A0A443IIU7_9BACI|nr:hypothetical protein [Siminovitchia fortis]RWR03963.1 hypothetical protein D4N35_017825 [Siminovitchia fortis]WHY83528.1 hypothetical protein QNH23_09240 [Siminovitchia fortis]
MEKKLDLILQKLDSLESGQKEVQAGQKELTKRLERTETKIDAITNQVANNAEQLQELRNEQQLIKQASMETNEGVKQLKTIQDSQHRIIELLSARSLEQESELRDLKRVK